MHYFKYNIGDFDRETRHLTRVERSIYRDLLDLYYSTETQIGLDLTAVCRLVIARTDEERTAVEQVLSEFFTKTPNGWYQSRCEREIAEYRANQSQKAIAGKASAAAKQAKREQALNGVSTGVEQTNNGDSTKHKPLTIKQETEEQEPLRVSLREPAKKSAKGSRLNSDWIPSDAMLAYAAANRPEVNAQAEAENFRDYWIAKPGAGGVKLDWEATWRTWIRRANAGHSRASPLANGKPSAAADFRNTTYTGTPYDELPPELR